MTRKRSSLYLHPIVKEKNWKETAVESVAVPVDEAARGFSSLKAFLSFLGTGYNVRFRSAAPDSSLTHSYNREPIPSGTRSKTSFHASPH